MEDEDLISVIDIEDNHNQVFVKKEEITIDASALKPPKEDKEKEEKKDKEKEDDPLADLGIEL